jgi:DnaJ-class molecular chaperone
MSEPKSCPDCEGRGYNYSDPDHKQLVCDSCDGQGEVDEEEGKS